jgi:hypothetical protein
MKDAGHTQHGDFSNSKNLLKFRQQEYMEILDEVAVDSVIDETAAMFDQVKNVSNKFLLLHKPE